MKSLMDLWTILLAEAGRRCDTSTTRDLERVARRVECEGDSFLTITMPQFGKDFERSLDQAAVTDDLFLGFSKAGGLPKLFRGFLQLVFDDGTGRLLDKPSIEAIRCLRQMTLMMGKVERPCSDARVTAALQRYVENDALVSEHDLNRSKSLVDEFRRMSRLLWTDVFNDVEREVFDLTLRPKHGPGATADRLTGNGKYRLSSWTERLEEVFPAGDFLVPVLRSEYSLDHVTWAEPGAELPVKVITVPKTLKTPRIIAIEPACMQYAQQAIAEVLEATIESTRVDQGRKYNPMRSFVGFESQIPNQEMAKEGSYNGSLATLDLSDASDLVSNELVSVMLERHPWLCQAVDATRSRRARVSPLGIDHMPLAKFASMGSALCFPIEAMYFTVIAFLGIQDSLNRQLTRKDLLALEGRVRIYGDDIIVPADMVSCVVSRLEAFGLKVNHGKSFWSGKFRESCGKEFYNGEDVSLVRVRKDLPARRTDVNELVSLISFRNQLYWSGWWDTVFSHLDPFLENMLKGIYPVVQASSPVLGRHSSLGHETERMCPNLHRPLVRGYMVKSRIPFSPLDGDGALLKWFLKRGEEPFANEDHLERQGRPDAVYIKLRWLSAV